MKWRRFKSKAVVYFPTVPQELTIVVDIVDAWKMVPAVVGLK